MRSLLVNLICLFLSFAADLAFGQTSVDQHAMHVPKLNSTKLLPVIRGVNLGGWLVIEPWITPSLFDDTGDERIVDEWTFCEFQDRAKASKILENHWRTWITEADFIAIKAAGLNHVRVPIGYWAFDISGNEPFIQGQITYLWKAIIWAQAHDLKVIIDLHGAPGSQNGWDNSGQRIDVPQWHLSKSNVDRTIAVIKKIASMFSDIAVVTSIATLNEPFKFQDPGLLSVTREYWRDSYVPVRFPYGTSQESDTFVMIHDAFEPITSWLNFMVPPQWRHVILDTHLYELFRMEGNARTEEEHIQNACSHFNDLSKSHLPVVVGEWTAASKDCTKYVNGIGFGSRYDGTFIKGSKLRGNCAGLSGKASSFSASYKEFLRKHWEAQVITFEKFQGWIQWTWKAEEADEWSYQAGLANGWIPQNPTDFRYPSICG